jgi:hypothetical protein
MCWRHLIGIFFYFSFMVRWYVTEWEELCPVSRAAHQMPSMSIWNAWTGRVVRRTGFTLSSCHFLCRFKMRLCSLFWSVQFDVNITKFDMAFLVLMFFFFVRAPQVWFEGDTVMNLEPEIRRASRLRCHRCGIRGAALGCYYEHCNKSFHVPCAVQIYGCRWDVVSSWVCTLLIHW